MIIDQELIKWNLKDQSANLNAEFEKSAVWRGKIHETSFFFSSDDNFVCVCL